MPDPVTDTELDTAEALDVAAEQDSDVAEALQTVDDEAAASPTGEASNSAMLNLLRVISEHGVQQNGTLMELKQLMQERFDAMARAQAGTDISAQRAAQSAQAVESAIEPVSETSPDAGEKPENIKELPTREVQEQRSKTFYFGKAALRHGKGRA